MGDLTPHFSRAEFRSKDGMGHPDLETLYRLVAHLEVLRCICGSRPMRIISGYRTPAHNRKVGGATQSRHLVGDAADLPQGYATVQQAEAAGFDGIGTKGKWAVHVDLRGHPARWTY
jgi:uncharacterized protein YcbK (DUF882 family)